VQAVVVFGRYQPRRDVIGGFIIDDEIGVEVKHAELQIHQRFPGRVFGHSSVNHLDMIVTIIFPQDALQLGGIGIGRGDDAKAVGGRAAERDDPVDAIRLGLREVCAAKTEAVVPRIMGRQAEAKIGLASEYRLLVGDVVGRIQVSNAVLLGAKALEVEAQPQFNQRQDDDQGNERDRQRAKRQRNGAT
jgi:hypothetical protein